MSRGAWPRVSLDQASTAVQMLAIIAAGAWGVYTFIYEAKIAPGLAPPTVSVTSTLEKAGERGDLLAIRSTVTRTNVGHTAVRVLGLTYNVLGLRVRFRPDGAELPAGDPGTAATLAETRYYEPAGSGEVLLRQGVLFEGATGQPASPSILNPGEAVSRDLIFYADRTRFDSLRFLVSLSYAKQSDPPVPLALERRDGQVLAVPGPGCREQPQRCHGLTTTDFATEFSLW